MYALCNGREINFYRNGIGLSAGEEKRVESQLVLARSVIGETRGDCKIKIILNEDYVLTNDFSVSEAMSISLTLCGNCLLGGTNLIFTSAA